MSSPTSSGEIAMKPSASVNSFRLARSAVSPTAENRTSTTPAPAIQRSKARM
jgi:hypothetical protein